MFLYRNDCIDGIMDTVLHIAQEMVCCNASFALRNYRRNNHTVTVELTNDETDFFIGGRDRLGKSLFFWARNGEFCSIAPCVSVTL